MMVTKNHSEGVIRRKEITQKGARQGRGESWALFMAF